MAYDFGPCEDARSGQRSRQGTANQQALVGQKLSDNPVPTWTARQESEPKVVFRDARTGEAFGLNQRALSTGVLLCGAPGGGKTNVMSHIAQSLWEARELTETYIIFDTKGDYLRLSQQLLPNQEKIVIGSGREYQRQTSYHNLFAEAMPRMADGKLAYLPEVDEDVAELCKQLFQSMPSETQPIFPAMAEQLLAAIMLYMIRTYWRTAPQKLNNKELIRLISQSTNEDLKKMLSLDSMQDWRSCLDYISNKGSQTQGVSSYLGTVLRNLLVGPFAGANPAREFSMRELLTDPSGKVVFIEYDLQRGSVLSPMYSILLDRALANALGGRRAHRGTVYFFLDEMLLLPKLTHLSDALNFGRAQGVKVFAGLQNMAGLEEKYGEMGAKNIMASFQNVIAFYISDYTTRAFLREQMGENYQNYDFSAQNQNLHVQRSGYAVEDWDLRSLRLGEAIVALAGEAPFLFTMPLYLGEPA